jgi:hypothetical protein
LFLRFTDEIANFRFASKLTERPKPFKAKWASAPVWEQRGWKWTKKKAKQCKTRICVYPCLSVVEIINRWPPDNNFVPGSAASRCPMN